MNLEELLTRSAHDLAAEVSPPEPDPLALGSQAVARRRRRRAITTGAAAAALVIAAVVVPEIAAQRSSPGPLEPPRPLPVPDAPAWVSDGQVHLGDKVLQVTSGSAVRFALTATGVVWAGESDPSGTGDTNLYWQTLEGAPDRLTDEPWRLFTTDPAGDQVVWVTRDGVMVTYDVVERRTVDSRYVSAMRDAEAMRIMPPVLFVSEERVVYEASGAVWSLDLGAHTAERLRGMSSDEVIDVGSDVTVVATSRVEDGKSGADSLGQLEFRGPGGSVRAEPGRLFREGRLSPDGRWFITSTGYEAGLRAVLLDTATGRQVPLDLPDLMRGAYSDPWGWSSPDVLMIELMATDGSDDTAVEPELWACRVSDGTCESLPGAAPVLPW